MSQTAPARGAGRSWLWPLALTVISAPLLIVVVTFLIYDAAFLVGIVRVGLVLVLLLLGAGGTIGIAALWTRLASPAARASAEAIALARAQHIELPDGLHSFSMPAGPRHQEREPARLIEPAPHVIDGEARPTPLPALPTAQPGRPLLQQLNDEGLVNRSGHQLLVGEENGKPVYIDSRKAGVVAIGGEPGSGKSSTVMNLLAQGALMQWPIVVCDPFPEKPDGVMKRSAHLGRAVLRRASSPGEIDAAIRWVDGIGGRRLRGEPWRSPMILVIEEFSNLIIRRELPPDTISLLSAMGMAYRSAGIIIVPIGHVWKASMLGGQQNGALIRQIATYTIVHRLKPDAAELLLPIGSEVNPASLPDGVALLTGPDGIYRVSVPWMALDDIVYAGAAHHGIAPQAPPIPPMQSAPPPAEPPRPAPIDVTPPMPRQAPPTTRLPDPSLADLIVDLLAAHPAGLDADSIATKLSAANSSTKTRLAELKAAGVVDARPASAGARRFVYSLIRRPPTA